MEDNIVLYKDSAAYAELMSYLDDYDISPVVFEALVAWGNARYDCGFKDGRDTTVWRVQDTLDQMK